MNPDGLVLLAFLIPLAAAALIPLAHDRPNLREGVTLVAAAALFLVVLAILPTVLAGGRPATGALAVAPGLEFRFEVEPLGMLFALVASTLWIVNSVYSIGYMRGHHEPRQTSFYVCFAIALSATIGIAFSANLLTLFLFYEILTISTYPLVAHKGNDEARRGGRVYLLILISTSMVFFLPAVIWTGVLAGTLDFASGGILEDSGIGAVGAGLLLALYAFGIGKAALMPFHYWLPTAMVAPTPVSALLHAVAVVKAGVFTVVKVVTYVFGLDFLRETGASDWLVFFASFCLLMASLIALSKDNLKARLAYSTVSQLSYVVLGAALATSAGVLGSGMHIAMHAAGKITLFFCAGAIYVAHNKTEISDMAGIGRIMPVTMFAFLVGSLSIIGLPPLGGSWSKWYLATGAADSGHTFVVIVLTISALLNVAYLLPIVARGYFLPPPGTAPGARVAIREAPLACVIPLCITAFFCLLLFFGAEAVVDLLSPMVVDGTPEVDVPPIEKQTDEVTNE